MKASLLWSFVHSVSWATYLGGALVMELIWRPAQEDLPPSQTAVACQWMGRRYRWIAAAALAGLGISGLGLLASGDASLSLSGSYGRTVLAVGILWIALVATLVALSFVTHPGLHARTSTDMTDEQRAAAREAVRRSIVRMDRALRFDLLVGLIAALLGASLHAGGIL